MTIVERCLSSAVVWAAICGLLVSADDPSSHSPPPMSEGKHSMTYAICSRLVLRTLVAHADTNKPPRSQTLVYQQHIACPVIRVNFECCGRPGNQRCCRMEDFVEPKQQRLSVGFLTAGALVLLAMVCFVGPAVCCLRGCPRTGRGAGSGGRGGRRRSGTLPSNSPVVTIRPGDVEGETVQADHLDDRRPLRSTLTGNGAAIHADYGAAAKVSRTTANTATVEDETPPPPPPLQQSPNLLPPPYPGF